MDISVDMLFLLCAMPEQMCWLACGIMPSWDDRAAVIVKDIFSPSESIFEELDSPDVCVHLAWKDGFIHNSPVHISQLAAHFDFIRAMINGGLKHLAVMGTMHEIGYHIGPVDADTPCAPLSMYGIAKDALRRSTMLLANENNICLQWLRAYYIYGDDENNHSIFTKITEAEKEGKEYFPLNSGKNKYDFIHIDELAKQIAATVMQTEVSGIINCCSGKPMALGDRVEQYIHEHEYSIKPQYGAFPDRVYDSPAIWGDASKIEQIMKSTINVKCGSLTE